MSLASKLNPPATLADLEALPPGVKGEIIEGTLYTQPRPRTRHQFANIKLGGRADASYGGGAAGGGWIILMEPGINLPGSPEFSPDIAGWRVDTFKTDGPDGPVCVRPDWACEILSPSNRTYDHRVKFPFYAREGVEWLWVVDLDARSVEVRRNAMGKWVVEAFFAGDEVLQASPFDQLAIPMTDLWLTP